MTTVYVVYHAYEPAPGRDEARLIGFYSTQERAEQAIARLRKKPGFRDHPDKFEIYENRMGLNGWQFGF